jgi:hypothetical protein
MDPQLVAAAIFTAGIAGVVIWMILRGPADNAEERGQQPPRRRSSTLLLIPLTVAWYGLRLWFTDHRIAIDVALAAILLVTIVIDVRRRIRR